MTAWDSIISELSWSMAPAEHRRLSGSSLTVADGRATVTAASEDAGRWLQAHMSHVIKRRLISNGIACTKVTINYKKGANR